VEITSKNGGPLLTLDVAVCVYYLPIMHLQLLIAFTLPPIRAGHVCTRCALFS